MTASQNLTVTEDVLATMQPAREQGADITAAAAELDDITARLQRLAIRETDPVLAARIRLLARHCNDAAELISREHCAPRIGPQRP
jgi:hypothetical protein